MNQQYYKVQRGIHRGREEDRRGEESRGEKGKERGGGIRETPYGVGGEGMVGVSTNLNWADYQEKNQP